MTKMSISYKSIFSIKLKNDLFIQKNPEKYNHIKGAIELGSLVGSITGLAIIAPQVSQALTHTVLKLVGLEKK